MTPTEPKVSARMCRKTPRIICEFPASSECEWPWAPPSCEWPWWLFNSASKIVKIMRFEIRRTRRRTYHFRFEYCANCANVMSLRRGCAHELHRVGMHKYRLNSLIILGLKQRKVSHAWPKIKNILNECSRIVIHVLLLVVQWAVRLTRIEWRTKWTAGTDCWRSLRALQLERTRTRIYR